MNDKTPPQAAHEEIPTNGLVLFSLKNPHFIIVACLMISILGVLCMFLLPKDLLPASNLPAVQIMTFYTGMPVGQVEKDLTLAMELYTDQAVGMQHQESRSLLGVSVVRNFFNSNTSLDAAISQTISFVIMAMRRLPPGTLPPEILPFDPMATTPLTLVAVSGPQSEKTLYDTARYFVLPAIQATPGAIAPTVMGGTPRQATVYLDREKLDAYNLSPLIVMDKLGKLNTFIPAGDVKVDGYDYQIESNGLPAKVAEMNDFPLRYENGVPVFLRDVGHAEDSGAIQTNVVMVDGKRQVYLPVYRSPGANSIAVVENVKKAMKLLGARLSQFKLSVVGDQTIFIRKAVESISHEVIIGGVLAVLMVLLFLGNPPATVAVLLSIPLSLLLCFIGFKAIGQTLNAMTLGGIAVSVGILIDNAIVVIENIARIMEHKGLPAGRATLYGASEVALPVLACTLATLVSLFPVVFLKGVVRILFAAFTESVVFTMISSYLCAMTVAPLYAAHFLKPLSHESRRGILALTERSIQNAASRYAVLLARVLRWKKAVLCGVGLLIVLTMLMARSIGTELFPRADSGGMILQLRLPTGTRIEKTSDFAAEMDKKLRTWIDPHDLSMIIANAGVYYGFAAAYTPNSGPQDVFFDIELTQNRRRTTQEYAAVLRREIPKQYPGIGLGIQLGGLMSSALNGGLPAPIDVQVEGPDVRTAHDVAAALADKIKALPGAVDVRVEQRSDYPTLKIDINRSKAAKDGISATEVVKNVASAVSGSVTFDPTVWIDPVTGIDYFLGVQFPDRKWENTQEVMKIPIRGTLVSGGAGLRSVPLGSLASMTQTQSMSEISHYNLEPVVDVFLDAQGVSVGELSARIGRLIKTNSPPLGYVIRMRGESEEMIRAAKSIGFGFLLSAVLVYLILVVQFRSFKVPVIIMTSVPLGLIGIVMALALTHTYFSIQAAIGVIFMTSIAVSQGVILLDFILVRWRAYAGKSATDEDLDQAAIEASRIRFRPIIMTASAAILGMLPMAVGIGHGAEANIPLGRAMVGGEISVTLLVLFVVPVVFRLYCGRPPESMGSVLDEEVSR